MSATNSILTPTAVTREALRILHQKLVFAGSINRSYDDSFANSGAKIGDTLKIRVPNQYTVRENSTLSAQNTSEQSVSLTIGNISGVDVQFSSAELTLSLDDFSKRILDPAMAVIASNVEARALAMYKDVYNLVDGGANAITFKNILSGRKALNDNLAPSDNNRTALLSTQHSVELVDSLKGLFQSSNEIEKQYKEGSMGRTGGFDFYESSHIGVHQTGTSAATTGYQVNGADQVGDYVTVKTGSDTFLAGDIVTFAGCYRVHPETKASTGVLQQFVVTANYSGGGGNLHISPSIVITGGRQNVSAAPTANGVVAKLGGGASATMTNSMVYHRDAFALATADLVMPKGVDFAAREVFDGISMRIVRQYSISDDTFPCRLDVLWGCKTIRPQLAARINATG